MAEAAVKSILALIHEHIDEEYACLRETMRRDIVECPVALRPFRPVWVDLRVEANLVVMGERLVVPAPARGAVLARLHLSHSGITKTMAMAHQLYFWPDMTNDITQKIKSYAPCRAQLPSLPMEPLAMESADYPMHKISTDLFDLDSSSFLVVVDRFSGIPWVTRLSSTNTAAVCRF